MKIAFPLYICLVTLGCAIKPMYLPPEVVNSPTLEFDLPRSAGFTMYKNGEDCSAAQYIPRKYLPHKEGSQPIPLFANSEIAFQIGQFGLDVSGAQLESTYCGGIISFIPNIGTEYRVKFNYENERCQLIFSERAQGDEIYKKSIYRRREPKFSMTMGGSFCHL